MRKLSFALPGTIRRKLAAIVLCASAIATATPPPHENPPGHGHGFKPDVFLITIDTLRADHVGCYGYTAAKTPALDGLAADGFRFAEAFTPSPITNTSHASILTGLLPSSHGVTDFGIPLAGHTTLAELLKNNGYQTAAFIGAVILDSSTLSPGFDRGFDFYDNFPADAKGGRRFGRVERRAMDVVSHAEAWLSAHPAKNGPRFVWVHLYDPHDPYEPPEPFATQFKDHLYDGEIAYADSALGHLLDFLKKRGEYQLSLIVVTADHGEGLGEHKEETHGIFLYDSTTHVPLIIKLGQVNATSWHGKVVTSQVRTIDIAPTILDASYSAPDEGGPNSVEFDGSTLRSALLLREMESLPAIGETDYPLRFGWAPLRSIRSGGKKLIEAPRPEFYDLTADPRELHDAFPQNKSAADLLRAQMKTLRAKQVVPQASDASAQAASLPDPKDHIEEQNLLHRAMMASDDARSDDARRALEHALAMDAKSPTALLQLGQLELAAGNFRKAADYLARARAVRPDDAAAALDQGRALAKLGENTAAKDALEASLALHPGQLEARLLLGDTYLKLGDAAAALDQFEAAGLLAPSSEAAKAGAARAEAITKASPKK